MTKKLKNISGPFAEIAIRLRAVETYVGMSQKEFSESAGVQQKSMSQWQSGDFRISIQGALKLRERYGISLDFIYCGNIDALPTKMANELSSILRDSISSRSNDNGDLQAP
ncbi:helix-turn-helix transcriptional regulator [Pseudovibrio axinellae]|uniref:helix-turn-helix transcriptional regulator n=1 Tax=Pseudovibrio axinellae TaxID=989403 RepID=UPI00082C790A|nr:helix-turn-helix transcriptional regulator [Pseudovibrio axinellae]